MQGKRAGIVSPPYQDQVKGDMKKAAEKKLDRWRRGEFEMSRPDILYSKNNPGGKAIFGGYSSNTKNIGNIKNVSSVSEGQDLSVYRHCHSPLQWSGLYDQFDGWKDMVTSQSFVHPAKMAPLLCQKIFEHLEELKMISHDSLVCDFMAGTGTTNIIASLRGYRSVSIELEPRFVRIEAGNRERLARYAGIEPRWRIIQGDSRNLSRMLNDRNITAVMSPSYGGAEMDGGEDWFDKHRPSDHKAPGMADTTTARYGKNNVGKLRVGVMSPSYGGSEQIDDRWNKKRGLKNYLQPSVLGKSGYQSSKNVGILSPPYENRLDAGNEEQRKKDGTLQHEMNLGGYSSNRKNIGNLRAGVISPPYQDLTTDTKKGSVRRASRLISSGRDPKNYLRGTGRQLDQHWYGKSSGQIGSMRAGMVSPPYANRLSDNDKRTKGRPQSTSYGDHHANIGNETDETYESAMLRIYSEAKKASITPLAIVTKNPTRKGQIVRLDLITADLLKKSGYQIFDYHQAVLFRSHNETSVDLDMNIREKTSHKGRIGFFRQLSLKKGGVAASWEDVIFAR